MKVIGTLENLLWPRRNLQKMFADGAKFTKKKAKRATVDDMKTKKRKPGGRSAPSDIKIAKRKAAKRATADDMKTTKRKTAKRARVNDIEIAKKKTARRPSPKAIKKALDTFANESNIEGAIKCIEDHKEDIAKIITDFGSGNPHITNAYDISYDKNDYSFFRFGI